MPRTPRIRAKDFFQYLKKFGCEEVSVHGSHHKIYNNKTNKTSVIAIHSNEILYPSMFLAILKQLDINNEEFINFINKK